MRLLYFALRIRGPAHPWKRDSNAEEFKEACISIILNSYRLLMILGSAPTNETLNWHDQLWEGTYANPV